jgi:hypothetical protein
LNPQCQAIKANGERCRGLATGQQSLCWAHDPANRERRRRTASRGGKAKPNRELHTIKQRLFDLVDGVLSGETDRSDAAVAGQLLNTVIRAIGMELKVKDQLDLLERLEALEDVQEQSRDSAYVA